MKKKFYALAMIAMMMAAANNADAQFIFKKSALQKSEIAKEKYKELTSNCRSCEQEVEKDTAYGPKYMQIKDTLVILGKSLVEIQNKYAESLKILQREIERNPYNTWAERNEYKKTKAKLSKQYNIELDAIYSKIEEKYNQLSTSQKAYWALIVDRKVLKID